MWIAVKTAPFTASPPLSVCREEPIKWQQRSAGFCRKHGSFWNDFQPSIPPGYLWSVWLHRAVCGRGGGSVCVRRATRNSEVGRGRQEQAEAGKSSGTGCWCPRCVFHQSQTFNSIHFFQRKYLANFKPFLTSSSAYSPLLPWPWTRLRSKGQITDDWTWLMQMKPTSNQQECVSRGRKGKRNNISNSGCLNMYEKLW